MNSVTSPLASAAKPNAGIRPLVLIMALSMLGFMAFNALIGPISRDLGWAEWQVGAIVTVAGLMWMVGAKPWGRRIDSHGPQHVLMLAMTGFTLVFVVLVVVLYGSLARWWSPAYTFALILPVRCVLSLFYGALPIASSAYVGQATTPAERGPAMAALGMGAALGMILGPASAALLSGFHLALPIAFGLLTAIVAWVLARKALKPLPMAIHAEDRVPLRVFDKRVRLATTSALISLFCVMSAQINTGFLVQDTFKIDTRHAATLAGAMLSAVGVALVVSGALVRRFNWAPFSMLKAGSLIAGLAFASTPFLPNPWLMALGFFSSGFGMGLVFPAFQTLASLSVKPHEQGGAAAAITAAQAMGMVVAPIVSTSLYHIAPALPYMAIGALLWVQVAVLQWVRPRMIGHA